MKNLVFSCLSWIPFVLILVFFDNRLVSSECLEDQRSLLLQLNSSLVYNLSRSSKLVNWDQTSDCCHWIGVQCNGSTRHVIGLDLSSESITSGIDNSSSLFKLQYLESLNLANNSFKKAQIPSGFGKLSGLTYLNLSNAGFSGQVPLDISQLGKLEILDISSLSYLEGFAPLKLENPSFTMLIRNLTHIRELYLDGVVISANGSEWGKALSSSVPSLQVLSLSNCNLSGEIDQSLRHLHSLSVVCLDRNKLAAAVPDFIANYRNLTLLKLSNCHLNGTFPSMILNVSTLKSLDLSYNELLQGTLPEFQGNISLQALILSFTNFSGQLPHSIGNVTQLRRIDLGNCNFTGQIPSSMESLHHLEYLDLSYNNFSGTLPAFSSAKNLTQLKLHHNVLNGTLNSVDWASLSKLVNLFLSSNSLHGTIPGSLLNLPSLLSIQLAQNELSGQLNEFNRSSMIQTLDLSRNTLEGPIPKSLFELQGLTVLDLSSNRFKGSLNLNLVRHLKNLSVLALSFNSLSVDAGSNNTDFSTFPQIRSLALSSCNLQVLPAFLKNQTRLGSLDLSNNQIQGRIPKWIWKVGNGSLSYLNLSCNSFVELEARLPSTPSLKVLDLRSNKLQGEVPNPPPNALYVDYSNNTFTSIPNSIGDFLNYTVLFSISRNNISGSIPTSFCTQGQLQVLDLSYNHLEGKIPDCLIQRASTLGVLNLRGNKLRGLVPDRFPGSCSLRTLNVNSNSLAGLIPRSVANCKRLEVLDLGKNQFADTFPRWLRSLPQLRVLVLRSNSFTGSIPCPPGDTMWPMLQIFDLASNHFDGELQQHCFLDWKAMMVEGDQMQLNTSLLQYPVFVGPYYRDVVSVTFKGLEFELVKIMTIFTSIDFSSNNFRGDIPTVIGNLNALLALNLSHNSLSSSIPSSLGNLTLLESLDLSNNNLSGSIPEQLAHLNFLETLDLSCNKLVGKIPEGTQLQSFDASSYMGNVGLCGLPLPKCPGASESSKVPPTREETSSHETGSHWQSIMIGTGFGICAGLIIALLMFWKKGRKWHDEQVNKFVSTILLACGIWHSSFNEGRLGPEEGSGHQLFDISSYYEDHDEDETEYEGDYGRFCVFCSKLDFQRRKVVHNPQCACHDSPSILSSYSSSSK